MELGFFCLLVKVERSEGILVVVTYPLYGNKHVQLIQFKPVF